MIMFLLNNVIQQSCFFYSRAIVRHTEVSAPFTLLLLHPPLSMGNQKEGELLFGVKQRWNQSFFQSLCSAEQKH